MTGVETGITVFAKLADIGRFRHIPGHKKHPREPSPVLYRNFANGGLAVAHGDDFDPLIFQGQSNHIWMLLLSSATRIFATGPPRT